MALTKAQLVDLNANELIIDLDADTSITADTDDQIDIKIAGADDFRFTANTFTGLAGSTITSPTIVGSTSVQTPLIEFTDGDDAMTIADGGVVTFAQAPVFPDGSLAVIDLDIDGATDIGAAIVDADLFIIDDGAGGTNRKTAASRLKTYIGSNTGGFAITNLDIDGGTDIGAAIVDADLFIIDDGAGGTNRKTAASRLLTYAMAGTLTEAAQTNITTLGTLSTLTVAGEISVTTLDIGGTNVTSTATELNLLDDKDATHLAVPGKLAGTNFSHSLLVGHTTHGTLSSADRNTGVGIRALESLTTADGNVAVGNQAGKSITTSIGNTMIGKFAGDAVSTGVGGNVYVGSASGLYNSTGAKNVGIGVNSLLGVSGQSNSFNTGVGNASLQVVTTGVNNIAIGNEAGDNITSGDGNVIIGSINADSATGDKQLIIADGVDGSVAWLKGDSSGNVTLGGNLIIGSATVTEAQLEILDGATITTTELNLIDGGATIGTTAVADGDGIVTNDGGTMRQTTVQTFATYFGSEITAMSNLVTTGALDSGSITSGFGAIDNGTSNIRSATITAETAFVPDAANGATLGTASLEFADMYLHDGGIVYFGADQDVELAHVADVGLTLKTATTSDDTKATLTLQTGETDIAVNDVLGQLHFQAPDEAAGTDAILVAAGIAAVSEGDFSASNNATKLSFLTGASEAASEKMSLSSAGLLTVADDLIVKNAGTIGTAADSDLLTMGNAILTVAGEVSMTTLDIGGTNVTSTAAELNKLDGVGVLKQAGKETIWIPSNAMTPTESNGAERNTVETTSGRPDMQVLDFDKDADEFAQFAVALPKSWNAGTVTFQFFWSGIAATTGVELTLAGVAFADNDSIDTAYGTAVAVADAAQGAVEEMLVSAESGAVTIAGSPGANEVAYFRIGRDVSEDDMAGDCRLHGIKLHFTTNAANDA